jgi:aspartate aminotransferase
VAPAVLDAALSAAPAGQAKLLILNCPGNPDGLAYTRAELEGLAAVLRKHGALVISDEIYGLLHHRGEHVSLAAVYPEATIVTAGMSKWAGAGGWRLGVALVPAGLPELKQVLVGVGSETYSCASAPIMCAAVAAYADVDATLAYVAHERRFLRQLGGACHARLVAAGLRVHAPEGGFYLFVDFNHLGGKIAAKGWATSDAFFAGMLQESHVALLGGSGFGMAAGDMVGRLAYVVFDGAAVLDASAAIPLAEDLPASFVEAHGADTFEGIDRLIAFLGAL